MKSQETEFVEKVVQVKRVTKVVKGGKKLSFRVVVIVGNQLNQVGIGIGKASEVISAIRKGIADGKKNLIQVPLNKNYSIPHIIQNSFGAASIILRPSSLGSGVIAGGAVRIVLELAGVKNVLAKQLGSNNKLNNAYATIIALKKLKSIEQASKHRA
uniref:ribosomal protein S5 n=1 Tax=Galdieria phlegrea TaxID=1389228 RepID=UPI0023D85DF0|nr:ribosomal protein S5 [Galdieria phlegrea]UNJ16231.1 ribosomal protein S5 [Galdieria sp.]WDA99717.1 ribosomal protein S5 [Galdieria sulphuraria]WDA99909.1 ribosomal protein S5 [Galdieria phlegrea]